MAVNLHLLRAFVAVADAGSFSAAADGLGVSQPAVSRAIATLEQQVGLALVERGAHGARLTEAGRTLERHARAIFNAERGATEALDALRGVRDGSLHIAASTTIATYVLPAAVMAFHRAHPAVRLRVTSANTRDIVERLLALDADVALVEGPVREPRVTASVWRDDALVVIAGSHHPLTARRPVAASELARQLMILREPGSGTREVVEQVLRRRRISPRRTLEVGSTEAIKQTVAAGLGLSVVSRAAAADQLALGTVRVLAVRGFPVRRSFYRLTLGGHAASPAARAFEQLLTDAGGLVGRDPGGRPVPLNPP